MRTKFKIVTFLLLYVFGISTASAVELVSDGGFEAGTPNPFWTESSTNFGTPLCTVASCGTGTGTGPNSGTWWAWFGGIGAFEAGLVSQPLLFPNGTAELSFWFENFVSDSASDFIEARVDGVPVWTYFGLGALSGILGYTEITINLNAFADGGAHTIEFYSEIYADNGGGSNFFVDDVSIIGEQSVPEPTTLLLIGLGLAGLGFSKRRLH